MLEQINKNNTLDSLYWVMSFSCNQVFSKVKPLPAFERNLKLSFRHVEIFLFSGFLILSLALLFFSSTKQI